MDKMNSDWIFFIKRPDNLFSVSLFSYWLNSKSILEAQDITISSNLFIEQQEGVVRNYRLREEHENMKSKVYELVHDKPKLTIKMMGKALLLNEKAERMLNLKQFHNLSFEEVLKLFCEVAMYGTTLPNTILIVAESKAKIPKKIINLATKLRSESYFPRLFEEMIIPLALRRLSLSWKQKQLINWMTLNEIMNFDLKKAKVRLKMHSKGKRFIYQNFNSKEIISFTKDSSKFIAELEETKIEEVNHMTGIIAHKGKKTGIARVVLSYDPDSVEFNTGDILVTINANPQLTPLIIKAGGIIAEEGGMGSHVAILSREFKIPCIMGVKEATAIIKTEDIVEVDANKGITKIIR